MLQFKYRSQEEHVPLKRVSVEVTIQSFAADVTITQVFRNDETRPIEAVYCFPIEEQAAVYAFRARIDDREIVAQLKKKNDAQKAYVEALRQGHGAYLLEQDEKSLDSFIVNVGALPANTECHITISYVSELDLVQNGTKIRFAVPTTIAPRYNPDIRGIRSPAGTTAEYVQSTPYTIDFRCRVQKLGIVRVSSMSHPIQVTLDQDDVYIVEFAQQDTHLDRDILVDIELTENRSNTIVAVEPGAIMASFTPTEDDCRRVLNSDNTTNEFIFIIDCSGSMDSENKIELARQAMLLFVKSLPVGCHFNIIRFGSRHETLFDDITAVYDKYNAERAQSRIANMKADLGGTELLRPLQWLEKHPPAEGHARQIFLLTDGEISNVDEVLNLCRSMSTSSRIFSFGLGFSPSHSLVKGLARATNGRFVLVPPYTNVDLYVGEQLQKALQPCITNVQIKWSMTATIKAVVPIKTPPIYVNDRLLVYAFFDNSSISFDYNASVELYSGQHRLGEAYIKQIPTVNNNQMITRLATKALILELQHEKLSYAMDENMTQERIVEVSLKHNILCPYTAFIGIEKRVSANNASMVLREVPIQISADDQHLHDQQLLFSATSSNYDEYRGGEQRYSEARRHYQDTLVRYCETLKECRPIYRDLLESEKRIESLKMTLNRSLELPKDQYENRSSPTYYSKKQRRDDPETSYDDAQIHREKMRTRYVNTWRRLQCIQDERDSSEMQYIQALQRLRVFNQKAYEQFDWVRRNRRKPGESYYRLQYKISSQLEDLVRSEEDYCHALEAARTKEVDRSAGNSKSGYGGLHRLHRSNVGKMTPNRSVNHKHQDTIREIINKQNFDGLWDTDSNIIEQLTGRSLTNFQQWPDKQVLTTAIIIVVFETRFVSLSLMWYGVVQKARKCLIDKLGKDSQKLDTLLEDIKKVIVET